MILRIFFLLLLHASPLVCKERASSYPYLSGDTWRFFCDWRLGKEEKFDPTKVSLGDIIFVEYDCLGAFSLDYLPRIQHRFILVTPNCESGTDSPMPGAFAFLLDSEKIAAWFLQNMDRRSHSKIVPIPIGLANQVWEHGDTNLLDQMIPTSLPLEEKKFFAYVNFSVGTNRKEREPCLNYFLRQDFAVIKSAKPFGQYLKDLSKAVFVISPPGNGLDCHRTWEALLMGCYPVVKSSTLNPIYEGLPVVIVNDWEEVTEEFLWTKYREFQSNPSYTGFRKKIYAPYWLEKARRIQQEIR